MMEAVKKESVHVGNGVMMRMKDGRLRITVPCSKRWRGGMFLLLYVGFILISNAYWSLPYLISRWLELGRSGEIFSSPFWVSLAGIAFWLLLAVLVVYSLLWFLLGQYVLEIGDKSVRAGRSLLGIEFLGRHETAGLRRIRFSPSLNMQGSRDYVFRTRWHTRSGKLFRPGRYTLHLDYGLKLRELLRMAIEERQVRTIKGIIRQHCPHLYQDSLKSASGSDLTDQVTDSLYLKSKLK